MKTRKRAVAVILASWIFVNPAIGHAAETRVYIRFSVGGAVVIGGGFLFWHFSYGSRVSRRSNPSGQSEQAGAWLGDKAKEIESLPVDFLEDRSEDRTLFRSPPLDFHLPITLLRW